MTAVFHLSGCRNSASKLALVRSASSETAPRSVASAPKMMNCCEGLTLRAGGAAPTDCNITIDRIVMMITGRKILIGSWRILISKTGRASEHEFAAEIFQWSAEEMSKLFAIGGV
jgi:hypothetical protein